MDRVVLVVAHAVDEVVNVAEAERALCKRVLAPGSARTEARKDVRVGTDHSTREHTRSRRCDVGRGR